MSDRRYRVVYVYSNSESDTEPLTFKTHEFSRIADAERYADDAGYAKSWVEIFNETSRQWELLTHDKAVFHASGRDVMIDVDGTGRFELFSSCANEFDARNMAAHYQENR